MELGIVIPMLHFVFIDSTRMVPYGISDRKSPVSKDFQENDLGSKNRPSRFLWISIFLVLNSSTRHWSWELYVNVGNLE